MANLADSFSADLEDLPNGKAPLDDVEADDVSVMEEGCDNELANMQALNCNDLNNVSKLQNTQRYIDTLQKVGKALKKGSNMINSSISVLEDDPEYQLIVDCNALSADIQNEIVKSKMECIAPNLSAIVGTKVGAKLMGTAGGLSAPPCRTQVLSIVTSNVSPVPHIDSARGSPIVNFRRYPVDKICATIEKRQGPLPAKQPKLLAVSDSGLKKRRGRLRLRTKKERDAIIKMRQWANQMQFEVPLESSLGNRIGRPTGSCKCPL